MVESRSKQQDYVVTRREIFDFWVARFCLLLGVLGGCAAAWILHRLESGHWAIFTPNDHWSPLRYLGFPLAATAALGLLPAIFWFATRGIRISRREAIVRHEGKPHALATLSLPRLGTYEREGTADRDATLWFFIGVKAGDEDVKLCETTRGTRLHARLREIVSELNEAIFWAQRYEAAQTFLREHVDREGSPYRAPGSKEAP